MEEWERELWEAELRAQQRHRRMQKREKERRRKRRRRRRMMIVAVALLVILLVLYVLIRGLIGLLTAEKPKEQPEPVTQQVVEEQIEEPEETIETDPETNVVITMAGLNVRKGPAVSYDRVGLLPGGTTIVTDKRQKNWAQIADSSYAGFWVCADYILSLEEVQKTGTVAVTGNTRMCLRAGPSKEFAVTQMIPNGTTISCKFRLETADGSWYYTEYQGVSGWVSGQYVRL